MDTKKQVSLAETSTILNELYMSYIRYLDVGIKWRLEYMDKKAPSICLKSISAATKTKEFMAGSYEAELPFYIYVKAPVKSTKDVLDIYSLLNKIAVTFEREQQTGFKDVDLSDAFPCELMMTSTPQEMDEVEDNVGIFGATYTLKYKKKGRYS